MGEGGDRSGTRRIFLGIHDFTGSWWLDGWKNWRSESAWILSIDHVIEVITTIIKCQRRTALLHIL